MAASISYLDQQSGLPKASKLIFFSCTNNNWGKKLSIHLNLARASFQLINFRSSFFDLSDLTKTIVFNIL